MLLFKKDERKIKKGKAVNAFFFQFIKNIFFTKLEKKEKDKNNSARKMTQSQFCKRIKEKLSVSLAAYMLQTLADAIRAKRRISLRNGKEKCLLVFVKLKSGGKKKPNPFS